MAQPTKTGEMLAFERQARSTFAYLNQDTTWIPRDPPAVRVTDMDLEWRYNAARWLERQAERFALLYTWGEIYWMSTPFGRAVVAEFDGEPVEAGPLLSHFDLMGEHAQDAFEHEQDLRDRDPVGWIQSTDLHRALVAGLPTKRRKLAKLAERARHWSTCPARAGRGECACELIRLADQCLTPEAAE